MNLFLRMIGVLVVLVGFVLLAEWCIVNCSEIGEREAGSRRTDFSANVAEDVLVQRSGYYGIDFVRCGRCSVQKRKVGPLTLGGFNILKLTDLEVVLPADDQGHPSKETKDLEPKMPHRAEAKAIAERLGLNSSFLSKSGVLPRFSGLEIQNLSVASLDSHTNVVPRFMARYGEARRDGLHMEECRVIVNGETNIVANAVLRIKPELGLFWQGGEMKF